jgi:DNA-binding transcriptional LysR family regulator
MPGIHATPMIREFAKRAPYLSIDMVFTSVTDQIEFLIDGRVDVCFVRLPLAAGTFTVLPLFPEPRVAAVPSSHPVAGSTGIEIKQIFDLPLLQDPDDVPEWHGPVARLYRPPGPDRQRRPTIEEGLERVALGAGAFVLPAGIAAFYRRDGISYVPLSDVAARMVALAYNKHRTMPELGQFAELVTSMLTSEPEPEPEPDPES